MAKNRKALVALEPVEALIREIRGERGYSPRDSHFQPPFLSTHVRAYQYHKAARSKGGPSQSLRTTKTTAPKMQAT